MQFEKLFHHLLGRYLSAGIVGPTYGADGSPGPATGRQSKDGSSVVVQGGGKYFEVSSRGGVYTACTQAGVAPGTAIGTTAAFALHNPIGSKYRLAIQKVSLGYVSGTLGAGTVFHCMNQRTAGGTIPAAPTGGTALNSRLLNAGNQSSPAAQGAARSGCTVTTPEAVRPFCSLTAMLATTAAGLFAVTEDVDGEFVLEPGECYQIQSIAAAGTTPLVAIGVSWQEVPFAGVNG